MAILERLQKVAADLRADLSEPYEVVVCQSEHPTRQPYIKVYRRGFLHRRLIAELYYDDEARSLWVDFEDPVEIIARVAKSGFD